jgi:hypothetical protein
VWMSLVTGLFFLVLLLNQQWSPRLRHQASHCSTYRIMCDVPSIAVFCSESMERFLGSASNFFLKLLVTIPVAPVITGIIVHFRFHIRCIGILTLIITIIIIYIIIIIICLSSFPVCYLLVTVQVVVMHAMKSNRKAAVWLHSLLTSVLDGRDWSASCPATVTHWIEGCVGSAARLDLLEKKQISLPCRDSNSRSSST